MSGCLTEHEETLYTGLFKTADTNKDGYLSLEELTCLCSQLGFQITANEVQKLFRALDSDGNKLISLDEFLKRMPNIKPEQRTCANLRQIFKTVDKNGDGYLTLEELFDVIKNCGQPFRESMVKAVVDKLDKSGDGKLDYEEFLKLVNLS